MSGERKKDGAGSLLAGMAGMAAAEIGRTAGGIGAGLLGMAAEAIRAGDGSDMPVTDAEDKAIRRDLGVDAGVSRAGEMPGCGPAYTYGDRTVHADLRDPAALAHEYGHASSPLMPGDGAAALRVAEAIQAGVAGAALAEGERACRRAMADAGVEGAAEAARALDGAVWTSRAASAFHLMDEGQASVRGLKAIARVRGPKAALDATKSLAPAYGTYVAQAVGSHVVAPLAGDAMGRLAAHLSGTEGKDDETK